MTKILVNSQGKALLTGDGKPLTKVSGGGHTGTVDTVGLTALGWDSDDIQWLQDHVWWDAEDDAEWAVTEANKAFGPNGATPLTWATKATIQYNPDVRYLPKLTPTAGLTSMASAFGNYHHLVAIPTHGWSTSTVSNFSMMFYCCYNLRSVGDVSYLVTSTVTNIVQMFTQCVSMEELDVSHWNTSNCTNFTSVFQQMTSLRSIDISGWSFAKVTAATTMLYACPSLRTVKLPATINAPVLTNVGNIFGYCYSLEELNLNLNAPALTTGNTIAQLCYNIQKIKVTISSTVVSSITQIGYMAACCKEIDLTGIDTTSVAQAGVGANSSQSPAGFCPAAATIKLGANFFKGSFTTLYMQNSNSWSRDSIYESLYTNQTTRDSNSNAVTVKLATQAYDRLSAQDISDIATKNITLTRG